MTLLDFEIQCNPIFQMLRQQFPSLQFLTTFLSSFLSSKTSTKFPLWNVFHSNTSASNNPYQIICIAPLAQAAESDFQSLLFHHFSEQNSNEINHYFNQIDQPVSFEGLIKDEDGNYSLTDQQAQICTSFLLTHLFVVQESTQLGINLNTKHIIQLLPEEKLLKSLEANDLFFDTQASVINWSAQDWEKNWQSMDQFFKNQAEHESISLLRSGTIELLPKQWKPMSFYIISTSFQYSNCDWKLPSTVPVKEVLKCKPIATIQPGATSALSKSFTNTITTLGNLFARKQVSSTTTTPSASTNTPTKESTTASTEALVESKLNELISQQTQPIGTVGDGNLQLPPSNSMLFSISTSESIESLDQSNSSKKYSFQDFMEKIKHKSAAALVKKIRNFIDQTNSPSFSITEAFPQQVHHFISEILEQVQVHPLWKSATELELDNTRESIEKYLTTKMYGKIFASSVEDLKEDEELHKKLTQLRSLKPEQFDILMEWILHPNWAVAMEELRKINQYKAPRDKMICLSNSCKLLFKLFESSQGMNADTFVPLLIYLVLRSNPPHLHSNIKFILEYRNPDKIVAEAAYFLTNMESAVMFWKTATASQLNMEEKEFQRVLSGKLFQEELHEEAEEEENHASLLQTPDATSATMTKSKSMLVQTPRSVNSSPIHLRQEDVVRAENQVKKQQVEFQQKEELSDIVPHITTTMATPRKLEDLSLSLEEQIKQLVTQQIKLSNKFSNHSSYMELQIADIPTLLEDYKQLYQLYQLVKKQCNL